MTDLEMTKLCAEAMGYTVCHIYRNYLLLHQVDGMYRPLHDDAQAMALVKRFDLQVNSPVPRGARTWWVHTHEPMYGATWENLNRAIVECVAKMQQAVVPGNSPENATAQVTR